MNMERAKNIIIFMLVLLNAALFALIYSEKNDYILSQTDLETIRSVLAKNNISIYAYTIDDFSPKKQLTVEPVVFSEPDILSLFFEETPDNISSLEDGILYETEKKNVFISANMIDFTDTSRVDTGITETEIYSICENFVQKITKKYSTLEFSQDYPKFTSIANGVTQWVFEYRSVYKNFTIYPCFMRVTITSGGTVSAFCQLLTPTGYTGDSREIYSSDEALFQLMYRLKDDCPDVGDSIKIMYMDVVYAFDEVIEGSSTLTPYYRFYVRPGGNEQIRSEPYLINAYNNTILY